MTLDNHLVGSLRHLLTTFKWERRPQQKADSLPTLLQLPPADSVLIVGTLGYIVTCQRSAYDRFLNQLGQSLPTISESAAEKTLGYMVHVILNDHDPVESSLSSLSLIEVISSESLESLIVTNCELLYSLVWPKAVIVPI